MLRKLAIAATVLVGIFLIAVVIGALGGGDGDQADSTHLDPSQLPERFQPGQKANTDLTDLGQGTGGWIQRTDPKSGRLLQEYRYDTLEPRAAGEFDVTLPEARFYIAAHRVVVMTAKRGVIVAPDNIPQQGAFHDDVLITVYETEEGEHADLSAGSEDRVLTLRLDDATFDTRLGKIDSTGQVTLNSDQADFRGRGLTLIYNEPKQRLDYLEVTEGEYLKYHPPDASQRRSDRPARRPSGPAVTEAAANAEQVEHDTGRVQYYKVVFERDVTVLSEGNTIEAEALVGLFSFNRKTGTVRSMTGRRDAPEPAPPVGALAAADGAAVGAAIAQAQPGTPTRREPDFSDVTMTWQGKMIVTPLLVKPDMLSPDGDALLTFTGSPVRVISDKQDVVTARHVEYHESWGQVGVLGSPEFPLRIDSPALGVVSADDLTVKVDEGNGVLWGRGSIVAHEAAEGGQPRGLPEGFSIDWSDRVELYMADASRGPGGLANANFIGDVSVLDPRFTMTGGQLNVRFDPTPDGKSRRFGGVDASGDVVARSEDGAIRADQLSLNTREDAEGNVVPTTLNASGHVKVEDKTQSIEAGRLKVRFRQRPADTQPGKRSIDVASVDGSEGVSVRMADGTTVEATTLVADNDAGTATMTGRPVVIVQDDAEVRVAKLSLLQNGKVADAEGAGTFVMIEPPTDKRPHVRRVNVKWTDAMHYSEIDQRLDVAGDVVIEQADKPDELNRLAAEKLSVDLQDAAALGDHEREAGTLLKKVTASGNVVVLATKWRDAAKEHVDTRLRISGPVLTYLNATEQVEVIGPGSMLIEDYRPGAGVAAEAGAVKVSGRGATAFTWVGGMMLDGTNTDLTLTGKVNMTHKPQGDQGIVELQTQKLVADMQGIGGLEVVDLSSMESLDIDHIEAIGQTQVRDAHRLISTHRLYYDGDAQTVLLEAQPGRQVEIVKTDEPKPIRAGRITWDLARDRIEVDDVSY